MVTRCVALDNVLIFKLNDHCYKEKFSTNNQDIICFFISSSIMGKKNTGITLFFIYNILLCVLRF